MNQCLQRAGRMMFAPNAEWPAIADERPLPGRVFARFVLPLALIPGIGWSLGLVLFGNQVIAGEKVAPGIAQIAYGGLTAVSGILLWVSLSAACMIVIGRLFGGSGDWQRALQVAAFSATPVMLSGLLLMLPDLMSILIIAFFHSLYLQYLGIQHVLRVKESNAAEFVALNTIALMVLSTAVGSLGSWLGML